MLHFVAGASAQHPRDQPSGWGGQIEYARLDGLNRHVQPLAQGDKLLEFSRRSMEPVRVPDHDCVGDLSLQVREKSPIPGTGLARVCTDIVV